MKQYLKLSRIAALCYLLYFIGEFICMIFSLHVERVTVFCIHFVYALSFIAMSGLIVSFDNSLKRPATYIALAAMVGIINKVIIFSCLRQVSPTTYSLVLGSVYLFYLTLFCIGFIQLAKRLPRHSMAYSMARVVVWVNLLPFLEPFAYMLFVEHGMLLPKLLVWGREVLSLAEVLAIALFCLSLPKCKRDCVIV